MSTLVTASKSAGELNLTAAVQAPRWLRTSNAA